MGGGRGDRGDRGDRNDRNERSGDRGFGAGGEDDWSKSSRAPQREERGGQGGGFSNNGGNRGGGGGEAESEGAWGRGPSSGGSRGFSGGGGGERSQGGSGFSGGDRGGGGGFMGRREAPVAAERPEHMRIKLDVRSVEPEVNKAQVGNSPALASADSEAAPSSDDKWNNVFGKSKSSASTRPAPPRAPASDNFGGNDSRFGGGDRERSDFSGGGGGGSFGRDRDTRGGGGGSYGDRGSGGAGGYGGRNEVSDPRFAGKFGSSSSGGHGGDSTIKQSPLPSFGPTPEEMKAADELKASKAAKAAERIETERKVKEAKEAAREAAKIVLEEIRVAATIAAQAATEAFITGLKGVALVNHIQGMEVKPSGAALTAVVLSNLEDPFSLKWCTKTEYGLAVRTMLGGDFKLQQATLHALQFHANTLKFPKIMVKEKKCSLIEMLFKHMYSHEIVDTAGFQMWAEDDDESNGKIDAIVQTTNFFQFLQEEEEGNGGDEEEEDDEIDAPRNFV